MAVNSESSRRPPIVTNVLVLLVRAYQRAVSPLFPATCRYVPSCSEYAAQALTRHGPVRGVWYAAARILRCHPWAEGGEDPVPR
jgi:putative membrane protein insertion efficiency factor